MIKIVNIIIMNEKYLTVKLCDKKAEIFAIKIVNEKNTRYFNISIDNKDVTFDIFDIHEVDNSKL